MLCTSGLNFVYLQLVSLWHLQVCSDNPNTMFPGMFIYFFCPKICQIHFVYCLTFVCTITIFEAYCNYLGQYLHHQNVWSFFRIIYRKVHYFLQFSVKYLESHYFEMFRFSSLILRCYSIFGNTYSGVSLILGVLMSRGVITGRVREGCQSVLALGEIFLKRPSVHSEQIVKCGCGHWITPQCTVL